MVKPFKSCFPAERLFGGESDGSSFPNGGLRVTHRAAAHTMWDRSSYCFIADKVLRIPCCFITHRGHCIDEKTPLLRSQEALNTNVLRCFKAMQMEKNATVIYSYLGWEQEFFVVEAKKFTKRPDLVNCGRTLIGKMPFRNQTGDLNYFGPLPNRVAELLVNVQAEMLRMGCAMSVRHNEVAPGQHEMSPIYSVASGSVDTNVYFMEACAAEAQRLGLAVLFHEKPFAGINGSGKHANWSIGTDTGLNLFHPGLTDSERTIFTASMAGLSWGLFNYNELVRVSVAQAGNDHRLGAQEAPPAIISWYPGEGFERHVDNIIKGGALLGHDAKLDERVESGCKSAMAVPRGPEDRNRTAPFPFCGNRFEFRAVGSCQSCAFPIMIVNAIFSAGMGQLADKLEAGVSLRDSCADLYKQSRAVLFTGNGYSKEWPIEAKRRGLPNLNTTPLAIPQFGTDKAKKFFEKLNIYSGEEVDARVEVMYENYNNTLNIEVETLIHMVDTGILPACARDLAIYKDVPSLAGDRSHIYQKIRTENENLKKMHAARPHEIAAEATYLCDVIKDQMDKVREFVDQAEGLMDKDFYPFPTYEALLFDHHFL